MGLAGATYLGAVLGLITGPLVARALGPAGRGEYAAVLIYAGFTTTIVGLGITKTVNYSLQTLRADPGKLLGGILRFSVLALLPAAAIAVVVQATVMQGFSSTAQVGSVLLVTIAPLGILQLCLTSFLISEGALGVLARVQAAPLLINAAGVITLALLGELTLGSYLAVTLVSILVPLAMTSTSVRVRPRRGGRLGPQLRFGLRAYPGSLASMANGRLDQALIAPFLGAADLGYYAVAVSLANIPLGVVQAVAARGVSQVGQEGGGLDPVLAGEVVRRGIVVTAIVSLAVAAVVPAFIPVVYGADFVESLPLTLILLAGTVALGVTSTTAFCLNLAGRPGATSIAEVFTVVVTAVALLVLLPTLGVLGAALASVLAYWTRAVLQCRALRKVGVERFVPRRDDAAQAIALIRDRLPLGRLRR
jgi:O-antigen/teichoic acid export membrane protein